VAPGSRWNADLYDEKHSFVWKMAAGLLDLLDAKEGEHILDLGCGTGHLTEKIAASGAKVVGVDKSADMIRQACESYPGLRFEVMDAREIAFVNAFDAVFSNATLHWVTEPDKAVAGIARALKPGGRLVAEFGGKGNVGELLGAVNRAWHKLGLLSGVPNPWYYPSIAEYSTILENHDLEVTFANLFERPTPLEDGERGLRIWLQMFGGAFLEKLPLELRETALAAIEEEARAKLFVGNHWVLDYRRLRMVAKRIE
jgi:trans-aconitate methyltransferase